MEWSFVLVDSLEKVFPDERPPELDRSVNHVAMTGETMSIQVAFRPPDLLESPADGLVSFVVETASTANCVISRVDLVPCELAAFPGHDEGYLRDQPGLYPDVLVPAPDGVVSPLLGSWRAAWLDVRFEAPGDHEVRVRAVVGGRVEYEDVWAVKVAAVRLPALDIVNTHWFHCDGLANYYRVPVFGEDHWRYIDRFLAAAVGIDVNSVLTPTWTPPLDTAVGGTRTPTQLIDIAYRDGAYSFGFAALDRWLALCRKHGIAGLEIAHLFTQWGARATPAVYVDVDGSRVQRFGWHVSATDPEYRRFLTALLPRLCEYLDRNWDRSQVAFHIADEPSGGEGVASYRAARAVVADLLDGWRIVDALSDFEFYASGLVDHPVVATDAFAPFLDAGATDLWVYYCGAQHRDVSNRFIALPSTRNRALGAQLFASGVRGFLHWGFNFYNTYLSLSSIDPFRDTCAGGAFPAGDPFIVYPGPGGQPYPSIRSRVFAQAMADHRAMQLLRDRHGRQAVLGIIDPAGDLGFARCSLDPLHYRTVRQRIHDAMAG